MGWNITSAGGRRIFKYTSIIIPLLPTFVLIIYNGLQLENLYSKSMSYESNFVKLQDAIKLSLLVSNLQDERYNMAFRTLSNNKAEQLDLNELTDLEEDFTRTDNSINNVPWRSEIPLKVFASQIRFQIRLDDLRETVKKGEGVIDEILDFYNSVIDALLSQYSKEVRILSGARTWKIVVVYKNILRAIDNIGINSLYVIKYVVKGSLENDEMIEYLKTQIQALEYMSQASNFDLNIRKTWKAIRNGQVYKKLFEIWEDVEDETTSVDKANITEVELYAQNLFESSFAYLNEMRTMEKDTLEMLRNQALETNMDATYDIYQSLLLIFVVLIFVAPLIIFMTVKTSIAAEAFIAAISKKGHRIAKEQRRSERLILKLLPPTVANRLMEQKRVSFTYDAATIMFCR